MSIRRGDTIIEILLALSVFSLISILALNTMNNGVVTAQANLEETMVRNEVNAQAEALRFIHANVNSGSYDGVYVDLWNHIIDRAISANDGNWPNDFEYPPNGANTPCSSYYDDRANNYIGGERHAFILNTRNLSGSTRGSTRVDWRNAIRDFDNDFFREAQNYARLLYLNVEDSLQTNVNATDLDAAHAEGIWIIAVRSTFTIEDSRRPQFYDFYIQSCWYPPGKETPSAIGSMIRLYNPESGKGEAL